jgi:hypothetical protein
MPDRFFAPAAMATLLCLTATAATAQTPDPTSNPTSAQPAGTMNAERGWSSIARCAQEDTERARHICVDGVLREAGLLTAEMRARQQRRAFGLESEPVRASPPAKAAASPEPASSAAAVNSSRPVASSPAATASSSQAVASSPTAPANSSPPVASSPAAAASSSPPVAPSPAAVTPPAQPDRLEVELAAVKKAVNGSLLVTTTDGAVWLQTESVDMPLPPVAGDRMSIRKGSMGGYRCSVISTRLTYRCMRSR